MLSSRCSMDRILVDDSLRDFDVMTGDTDDVSRGESTTVRRRHSITMDTINHRKDNQKFILFLVIVDPSTPTDDDDEAFFQTYKLLSTRPVPDVL